MSTSETIVDKTEQENLLHFGHLWPRFLMLLKTLNVTSYHLATVYKPLPCAYNIPYLVCPLQLSWIHENAHKHLGY